MVDLFQLLLFIVTTVAFGYMVSFVILRERKLSLLVPLSLTLGLSGYVFLVNTISYAIPIIAAFWLIFILFAAFVVYELFSKGMNTLMPEIDFSKKELQILFGVALAVAMLLGVVQERILSYDDYVHLTFASSIAAGNFPVMNPMNPDVPLVYHYAPDLLAGAIHAVSGVSLLQGYDVQTFVFTLATFLLAFALAFRISKRFSAAMLAATFFVYGSGALLFLHVFDGIDPLYHRYILHEPVVGAWKFVADMIFPQFNHLYTKGIWTHTFAMGTPIILATTYLYFKLEEGAREVPPATWIVGGLLLGFLALSIETSFVILSSVLFLALLYKSYHLLMNSDAVLRQVYIRGIAYIGAILLIGSMIAIFQGGVITATIFHSGESGAQQTDDLNSGHHFSLNKNPLVLPIPIGSSENVPLYSPLFLEEFGLLVVVFAAALYAFRRNPEVLFLSTIGIVAFFTPILVIIGARNPGQLVRIFSLSTTIFSFMCALYIGRLMQMHAGSRKIKYLLVVLSFLLLYDGLAFQIAGIITPFSSFGEVRVPFIAQLPQLSGTDVRMYRWISSHTPHDTRFFPYSERLIIETGRMSSPGNDPSLVSEDKIALGNEMFDTCDADIAKRLGITYIVVSPNGFSRDRYKQECSALKATLVYSEQAQGDYRDIYQITSR